MIRYIIEKKYDESFSDTIKSNPSTFHDWMSSQGSTFKKLKEIFHLSDENFIKKVYTYAKEYAKLADEINKIPTFKEFYKYLKDKNLLNGNNYTKEVYEIIFNEAIKRK